jgi:hypothetical protein
MSHVVHANVLHVDRLTGELARDVDPGEIPADDLVLVGRDQVRLVGGLRTRAGSAAAPSRPGEAWVLKALGRTLMAPDLVAEFITTFNAEWRRLAKEARQNDAGQDRDLRGLERQIANLIDAIGDGGSSPAILSRLVSLESHRPHSTLGLPRFMRLGCVTSVRPSLSARTPKRWKPHGRWSTASSSRRRRREIGQPNSTRFLLCS